MTYSATWSDIVDLASEVLDGDTVLDAGQAEAAAAIASTYRLCR